MGPAALQVLPALLVVLRRGASSTGGCAPMVVTSGSGCSMPVPDATTCTNMASQHPLIQAAGSAVMQQAPDRPSACWWQQSNGLLWFNAQSGGAPCSDAFRCICCSPFATSPVTVTSISVPYALAGVPTEITLQGGAMAAGDKVAWAEDCSAVSPSRDPGLGGTATYTFAEEGVLKLCYRASGTSESVEQVGIELEVVGTCIPEPVTSGPSGACQWPILTGPQCSYKASLHRDIADDAVAVLQDAFDRPAGCWWQPGNGGLYFNTPSGNSAPMACSESFVCICCLVTTTSTTATATTVTLTTTTITTTTLTTSSTTTSSATTTTTSTSTTSLTATTTTSTTSSTTLTRTTTTTASTTTTSRTTTSTTTTSTATTSTTTTSTATTSTTTTPTTTTTTSTTTVSTTTTSTTTSRTTTTTTSTTTTSMTTTTTTTSFTATTTTSTTWSSTMTTSTTATSTTSTSSTTSSTSSSTTSSTVTATNTSSTTSSTSSTTTTSRTTTTTTTSTTTTTRSDTFTLMEMDVTNLDYHRLVADAPVLASFEDTIKRTIIFETRDGALAHMIDLVLSPGSTSVAASIYVEESEQRRVYSALAYSRSLHTNMQSSVADVPGIAQVSSGPLGVLRPRVVQVVASCNLYVCPTGFDDRPASESLNCSSVECSADDCCAAKATAAPPQSGGADASQAGSNVVQFVVIGCAVLALACFLLLLWLGRNRLCRPSIGPEARAEPKEVVAVVEPAPPEEEFCEEAHGLSEGLPTAPKDVADPFQRTCPKGHALQSYTVPWSGDFSCDRCGQEFGVGATVWTCEGCHYDLCNACSGGGDEELPRCPRGHGCVRFALEPGDYTSASCSRCAKADLARSCSHFFRCGACQYDVCPDCTDPSKSRDTARMQEALMQSLALTQERAQMVARRPPDSMVLQSAEHAVQLDVVDLHLLREGHDSAEVGVEAAIRIVNATSMELSRIMGDVQVAPTGAKQALLAEAEALEQSEEYLRARRLLQSFSPSVFGVDPFGGTHVG